MQLAKTIQLNAELCRVPANDIRKFLAQAILENKTDSTKIQLTAETLSGIIKLTDDH